MKHIPDSLWSELEKLILQKKNNVGRPEFDNRKTLNGIIYILHTGAQWNMLPEKYGCPSTVHGKFMKWCRLGVFHKIMVKAREHYRRRNSKIIGMHLILSRKKHPLLILEKKTQPTELNKE